MLTKVISGGQTGADIAGLIAAKEVGITTGGTAPKDYRTENGSNYNLKTEYGLVEDSSYSYVPRTKKNIKDSDGTLIVAYNLSSAGTKLTLNECKKKGKPHLIIDFNNPNLAITPIVLWIKANNIKVLNVAGNRNNGDFEKEVTLLLKQVFTKATNGDVVNLDDMF